MKYKNKYHITEAEWEAIKIVLANKKVTSKFVSEILEEKMNWKAVTSKSLLRRLLEKEILNKEEEKQRYLYYSNYSEQEIIENEIIHLLSKTCKTKVGGIIGEIIKECELSKSDLDNIKNIIKEKEINAPKEVKCECYKNQCDCKKSYK